MTNSLTGLESEHLLNFIGYGRLDADVWFLGTNEAVGKEANIQARLKFQPVEDNAKAHKMLGITHLHWGRRKIKRTWCGLCFIMPQLKDQDPSSENIRNYQAENSIAQAAKRC